LEDSYVEAGGDYSYQRSNNSMWGGDVTATTLTATTTYSFSFDYVAGKMVVDENHVVFNVAGKMVVDENHNQTSTAPPTVTPSSSLSQSDIDRITDGVIVKHLKGRQGFDASTVMIPTGQCRKVYPNMRCLGEGCFVLSTTSTRTNSNLLNSGNSGSSAEEQQQHLVFTTDSKHSLTILHGYGDRLNLTDASGSTSDDVLNFNGLGLSNSGVIECTCDDVFNGCANMVGSYSCGEHFLKHVVQGTSTG
jgi:hypothetical protein